jgi:hypothetical protein
MLFISAVMLIAFSFQFLPYIGFIPVLSVIIMMGAAAVLAGLLILAIDGASVKDSHNYCFCGLLLLW